MHGRQEGFEVNSFQAAAIIRWSRVTCWYWPACHKTNKIQHTQTQRREVGGWDIQTANCSLLRLSCVPVCQMWVSEPYLGWRLLSALTYTVMCWDRPVLTADGAGPSPLWSGERCRFVWHGCRAEQPCSEHCSWRTLRLSVQPILHPSAHITQGAVSLYQGRWKWISLFLFLQ